MHLYDVRQGGELVKAARNSIEIFLSTPRFEKRMVTQSISHFKERYGVFVTLEQYPAKELRGCIGFPRAVAPLDESVVDAAIAAAFEDPRFVPVSKGELDGITVEISILSEPELVEGSRAKRLEAVKVGRDGLMIEYGLYSGLLLPVVAVEQHWSAQELLEQTCLKAGLGINHWPQPGVTLYRFQSQVFREDTPGGRVVEVQME